MNSNRIVQILVAQASAWVRRTRTAAKMDTSKFRTATERALVIDKFQKDNYYYPQYCKKIHNVIVHSSCALIFQSPGYYECAKYDSKPVRYNVFRQFFLPVLTSPSQKCMQRYHTGRTELLFFIQISMFPHLNNSIHVAS